MQETSAQLRVAISKLSPRQRMRMRDSVSRAGEDRNGTPAVAAVYAALAAVITDVDRLERIKGAAEGNAPQAMRGARIGRA